MPLSSMEEGHKTGTCQRDGKIWTETCIRKSERRGSRKAPSWIWIALKGGRLYEKEKSNMVRIIMHGCNGKMGQSDHTVWSGRGQRRDEIVAGIDTCDGRCQRLSGI